MVDFQLDEVDSLDELLVEGDIGEASEVVVDTILIINVLPLYIILFLIYLGSNLRLNPPTDILK